MTVVVLFNSSSTCWLPYLQNIDSHTSSCRDQHDVGIDGVVRVDDA